MTAIALNVAMTLWIIKLHLGLCYNFFYLLLTSFGINPEAVCRRILESYCLQCWRSGRQAHGETKKSPNTSQCFHFERVEIYRLKAIYCYYTDPLKCSGLIDAREKEIFLKKPKFLYSMQQGSLSVLYIWWLTGNMYKTLKSLKNYIKRLTHLYLIFIFFVMR